MRLARRPGFQAMRSSNWLAGSGLASGSFSQIAPASLASFLLPFTYGLTNCGAINLTLNPRV